LSSVQKKFGRKFGKRSLKKENKILTQKNLFAKSSHQEKMIEIDKQNFFLSFARTKIEEEKKIWYFL